MESQHLNDKDTIKKLEELTASERAVANAHLVGRQVDDSNLEKLRNEKRELVGLDELNFQLTDQDAIARRQKLDNYQNYRKKVIHKENTQAQSGLGPASKADKEKDDQDDSSDDGFMAPYTLAVEDKLDSEFAYKLNETIQEGPIDLSKAHLRVIQTITRGNFFNLINPKQKPKMFLVCMDFSPELIFALEWLLGTVLVDGLVLFIVCVIEETDTNHNAKGNGPAENQREQYRLNMLNKAKQQVLNLLKLTKLQIHIVIEIIHHPIPRHLILEIIDNLQPTLVVVGSNGQSAIKGVLLGSLSNYLVTKLSVPVMVVREKLKKINRFKLGSHMFSNNIKSLTLSEARID